MLQEGGTVTRGQDTGIARGEAARDSATGRRIAVPIWDWPVRAVHWALVLLVAMLLATGFAGDDWLIWHMRAGEALLALVLFRVLWGFAGTRHARFASFVRGPTQVRAYARSLIHPPHALHAGHNPLGGWMVVALLLVLLVQAGLGLCTNDDVLYEGPLVRYISKDLSDTLSSLHRRNAWIVIALASAHIVAALAYLAAFRDNLIKPMFTGTKMLPRTRASEAKDATAHATAAALLALCAVAVWLIVRRW
jgi:cytochrome b